TPLLYTAKRGYIAVVKLLLKRANVNINCIDSGGNRPLLHAVINGHIAIRGEVAIVKLLLKRADVNINRTDSRENGPLLYTAIKGHKALVKLLLERADININCKRDIRPTLYIQYKLQEFPEVDAKFRN
ncbi:ankyrin, partial [Cenococcum geophilum 1.58]|uniref:ankyrin n=1 Tax=Cenococcum geophilum 1.58 TaxID=794803 RepID=UPI00358EFD17